MEGRKILVSLLLVASFALVWAAARVHQEPVRYSQPLLPQKRVVTSGEKMVQKFSGVPYACENGNTIYIAAEDGIVEMTLVYPDETYGTARFSTGQRSRGAFILDDGENRLEYDGETATFAINDVVIADTCAVATR